jgi:hypothetical protein
MGGRRENKNFENPITHNEDSSEGREEVRMDTL